jgi:hypothetical protein
MPVQISHTAVLGSALVVSTTGQAQNIFDKVRSSAWISSPITGSKVISAVALHETLYPFQSLFDFFVRRGVGATHIITVGAEGITWYNGNPLFLEQLLGERFVIHAGGVYAREGVKSSARFECG